MADAGADPARVAAHRVARVLWDPQPAPTRGPKPALTRGALVRAAVTIADTDGLTATTLRSIAEHLGVSIAGLYRYVTSKSELLALMVEHVMSGTTDPPPDTGWRTQLEHLALQDWQRYQRHPWLLEVPMGHAPPGPSTVRRFDAGLRAALRAGFPERTAVRLVTAIDHLVVGAARDASEQSAFTRATGRDAIAWWQMHGEVSINRHLQAGDFPGLARVIAAEGFTPPRPRAGAGAHVDDQFRDELNLLLDGIEQSL